MKTFFSLTLILLCSLSVFSVDTLADGNKKIQNNQEVGKSLSTKKDAGKRCMMVCVEWEQKCQKNPKSGQENCRRVCTAFGEQCF